ncbi:MAG TPA: 23S rRNA (adenine(2503)-C(2))-methyltransferase RlmN [Candidatus Absconditabacterales bacterium]|nr:23S rRNA (adenine(2503)-C(2))-methyltransferase RlmN [Candidatus Absconditabacterales bacterium]
MEKFSIFNAEAVEEFRKEEKLQPFRVKQIFHEIFKNAQIDFKEMTTLSKDLREKLDQKFQIIPFELDSVHESAETTKFLFRLPDTNLIESVIMFHFHDIIEGSQEYENNLTTLIDGKKLNRLTLCISSQVGCPVGCIFCVTGKLGFSKNLSYEAIVSQVLYANHYLKNKLGKREDGTLYSIRNIVFMGMGEPLLNYDNVKKTVHTLLDQNGFSLSRRHVTISTSGIIPGIEKMTNDKLGVMLALSLHSPNQTLRQELIPTISKVYTLDLLMKAIDDYTAKTDQRMFYEYVMIKDKTDRPELAYELAELLKNRNAHLNLIPYNENPAIELEESSRNKIMNFKNILVEKGITVTVRDTLGRGIQGACGQLGYEKVKKGEKVIR